MSRVGPLVVLLFPFPERDIGSKDTKSANGFGFGALLAPIWFTDVFLALNVLALSNAANCCWTAEVVVKFPWAVLFPGFVVNAAEKSANASTDLIVVGFVSAVTAKAEKGCALLVVTSFGRGANRPKSSSIRLFWLDLVDTVTLTKSAKSSCSKRFGLLSCLADLFSVLGSSSTLGGTYWFLSRMLELNEIPPVPFYVSWYYRCWLTCLVAIIIRVERNAPRVSIFHLFGRNTGVFASVFWVKRQHLWPFCARGWCARRCPEVLVFPSLYFELR